MGVDIRLHLATTINGSTNEVVAERDLCSVIVANYGTSQP